MELGNEDASPNNSFTILRVEYNSRAQSAIDLTRGDNKAYFPPNGRKWLVVKMRIQNKGEQEFTLTPALFEVGVDGAFYQYSRLEGSPNILSNVDLTPTAEITGWTAYPIPSEARSATLRANQDAYFGSIEVNFYHYDEILVDVPVGIGLRTGVD